jgi:hypothetical protein
MAEEVADVMERHASFEPSARRFASQVVEVQVFDARPPTGGGHAVFTLSDRSPGALQNTSCSGPKPSLSPFGFRSSSGQQGRQTSRDSSDLWG